MGEIIIRVVYTLARRNARSERNWCLLMIAINYKNASMTRRRFRCWISSIVASTHAHTRTRIQHVRKIPHFAWNLGAHGEGESMNRGGDGQVEETGESGGARALACPWATRSDFMPAKIRRVIDSNMAVTSCKLSCCTSLLCLAPPPLPR